MARRLQWVGDSAGPRSWRGSHLPFRCNPCQPSMTAPIVCQLMYGSDLEDEVSENYKFRIDDACQGHGRCYVLASQWFDEDEHGQGEVRDVLVSPVELAEATEMLEACPEGAVRLERL